MVTTIKEPTQGRPISGVGSTSFNSLPSEIYPVQCAHKGCTEDVPPTKPSSSPVHLRSQCLKQLSLWSSKPCFPFHPVICTHPGQNQLHSVSPPHLSQNSPTDLFKPTTTPAGPSWLARGHLTRPVASASPSAQLEIPSIVT